MVTLKKGRTLTAQAKRGTVGLHGNQQSMLRKHGHNARDVPQSIKDLRHYYGDATWGCKGRVLGKAWLAGIITSSALMVGDIIVLIGWLTAVLVYATYAGKDVAAVDNSWLHYSGLSLRNILPFAGSLFVLLASRGHYSRKLSGFTEAGDVFGASAALMSVYLLTKSYEQNSEVFWWGVAGWVTLPFALFAVRSSIRVVLDTAGLWKTPVLVVGDTEDLARTKTLIDLAKSPAFHIVAEIDTARLPNDIPEGYWQEVLRMHNARRLVLAFDTAGEANRHLLRTVVCEVVPFTVLLTSTSLPIVGCDRTSLFSYDAMLTHYRVNGAGLLNQWLKAAVDLSAAVLLLVCSAPVMLALSLAIRRDGGPVFFAHERIGIGGKKFRCLKFRSMVTDPARVLREHLANNPEAAVEWAATHKLRDDPRITRVGRFLRAMSLDELPQLVNILRREMSLVGPRPITEGELARYGEDITYYLRTRPGLTGLWQVSGRSDISYTRRVELDAWYVRNQNWWHDLVILALTIPAVLKRNGAR